jgi:hypothetical protein
MLSYTGMHISSKGHTSLGSIFHKQTPFHHHVLAVIENAKLTSSYSQIKLSIGEPAESTNG